MRSPVRGLSPSDSEEASDSTPLLQDAPRAEAGEQRRGSRGFGRAAMGSELLKQRVPSWGKAKAGGDSRKGRLFRAPRSPRPPRCPKAAPEAVGDREATPGGRLGRTLASAAPQGLGKELLGAAATGVLAILRSFERGNAMEERTGGETANQWAKCRVVPDIKANWRRNLHIDGQRTGPSRWLFPAVTARFPQLQVSQHVIW